MIIPYTLCLIRRADQLLLLNRVKAPNMGLWNGVGGKISANESAKESIIREIKEETSMHITDVQPAGLVRWVNEHTESGMYLYYVLLKEEVTYSTPKAVDEGILDWKAIDWVLHPDNDGVVDNMKHFLPHILSGELELEHIFTYDCEDQLIDYRNVSLTKVQV